jgi:hypothetical protein
MGIERDMAITRLKAPTLSEVNKTIESMEKQFSISSREFVSSDKVYHSIPEDYAAAWEFALEQQRVLQSKLPVQQYWMTASKPQTYFEDSDSTQRRESQHSVAA